MSLLEFKSVRKKLRDQEVLKGVNFELAEGENLVIIGRSGGGKSVLLRHIMGLLHPDSGEVVFQGKDLSKLNEFEMIPLRRQMGMLFQNGALFDSLTVGENVAFPLREEKKLSGAEIEKAVAHALELVDLPKQQKKMPAELSGGMRKRVSLARATIRNPRLILYDEPTSGLDPVVADSINKLMLRLGDELKMTAIIVTHDMVSAAEVGDRIAMLHEGRIHKIDTPENIRNCDDPVVYKFVRGISDARTLDEDKL